MVLSLNEPNVGADAELVLELTPQAEEDLLLSEESELCSLDHVTLLISVRVLLLLLLAFFAVVSKLLFSFVKHRLEVVPLLDIFTDFKVLIVFLLESEELSLVVARDDHGDVEVPEGVELENLQLRVMLQVEVVQLRIFELPSVEWRFGALDSSYSTGDVLKEQSDRRWY